MINLQAEMSQIEDLPNKIKRPSMFWLFTEAGRALTELSISIPYRTLYRNCEQGDGHPVLVLPGFMASDRSTGPLRKFVDKLGYSTYGWNLGRNYAKIEFVDALLLTMEEIYETHQEPITLIGWSLGGVFARQLAKAKPEWVRQVITLGSPFRGVSEPNNVAWIYNLLTGGKRVREVDPKILMDIPLPAPVPTTAIYTKEDGIVPWKVCLEREEDEWHQNIQVRGSHLGLGVNPTVLNIIADRLLYTKSCWGHFRPHNIVNDLLFYPSL
ncbi:MAG: alpha/beta hydrolase [Bacteroidota bacterium]